MQVVGARITGSRAPSLFAAACLLHFGAAAAAGDYVFEDGFDIDRAAAFYVSPQGLDSNPGTQGEPFLTIGKGITAAAGNPDKYIVIVANGTYSEGVVLADGVSVYGQFQSGTWARDRSDYTVIDGTSSAGIHQRAVAAANIVSATTFDSFVVFGPANATAGANSYAIYVSNSSAALQITHDVIFGGRGGPGAPGVPGIDGADGVDGAVYTSALDAFTTTGTGQCNASNDRPASGGGVLVCPGSDAVSGGDGGGNNCTPQLSTQNSTSGSPATAGQAGAAGGSGGAVGARGYDSELNASVCHIPNSGVDTLPLSGTDGSGGGDGGDAASAAGCLAPAGTIMTGNWSAGSGYDGSTGTNGGGGGGGGAGGGSACTTDSTCKDMLGGHGGGGGSGGCGGSGGGGGGGGGGAFDIFIVGNAAPVVTDNTLFLGSGGDGGNGGTGGVGGLGGSGGQGGHIGALSCTGAGGNGGFGGLGGQGSGGGGGCGGISSAIYTSGIGTPTYCASGNNVFVGGTAGTGGTGGASLGQPGGDGQSGVLADCSFH